MKRWIHATTVLRKASSIHIGDCAADEDTSNFNEVTDIRHGKDGSIEIQFEGSSDYIPYDSSDMFKVEI